MGPKGLTQPLLDSVFRRLLGKCSRRWQGHQWRPCRMSAQR